MSENKLYRDVSQILLGSEQIYPNLEIIPRVRFALERLSSDEKDSSEMENDFFSILKLISNSELVAHFEYLVSCRNSPEAFNGVMRLIDHTLEFGGVEKTSENSDQVEKIIFKNLRVYSNQSLQGSSSDELQKILLAFLDDLASFPKYEFLKKIKEIYLETDTLNKIRKIIQYIAAAENDEKLPFLEKLYVHYLNMESDLQVWKFLYEYTEKNIFNRIRVARQKELAPRLGESFSKGQVISKLWAIEELNKIKNIKKKNILLLCSWYGLLGRMMYDLLDEPTVHIDTVDIDESCLLASKCFNYPETDNGHYVAYTKDIFDIDYSDYYIHSHERVDLIVNTSCEHISNFSDWYGKINNGELILLQSNNFFDCEEHSNCVSGLDEFKKTAPMSEVLFEGVKRFEKYDRYMLIGRK